MQNYGVARVNNIPTLDLTRQYAIIGEEVNAAVLKVLSSGRYIGGPVVQDFEQQLASYIGVSQCITCNSGTDALYLALRALNIGPGDEVITTPFTFIATAEVISITGATPVFVDIYPQTFNINVNQLAAAITPKTRAIIPVHLFGHPVEMTSLMSIARDRGIPVIEDCAQAIGAEWAGQKVGSMGDIGCFSFFPTKNLGACGDGGACTTSDSTLAAKMRMLKEHGSRQRYYHEETGINSRLDSLQAAILQIKLRYLDLWNDARRAIATRYHQLLNPVPGIILPQEPVGGQAVWNQYTIRLKSQDALSPIRLRDSIQVQLQKRGINSMVYYPIPLHLQSVYQNLGYQPGQFPIAEQISHEVLSLPMFPELSVTEQEQIVYGLKDSLLFLSEN